MKEKKRDRRAPRREGPYTLAIDVGGTGLKASVLDSSGKMLVERVRVKTPYPCRPDILLHAIAGLVEKLPPFDRISIGFPGVIRDGKVITAPHFDRDAWQDYGLEDAIARQFDKPARLLNDAEVQGLGIIAGRGLELVLTLGTGAGTALFRDGALMPHMELAQHPIHKSKTYNDYIGDKALKKHGSDKWNHRLHKTIGILFSLLHYDTLYLAGGNAVHVELKLPPNVRIGSNAAGITGGVHLWDGDFAASRGGREA